MWKPIAATALTLVALTGPAHMSPALGFHDNPLAGVTGPIVRGCSAAIGLDAAIAARMRKIEEEKRAAEIQHLRSRAEAGDLEASYLLGMKSHGTTPEAIAWLCRAADGGHGRARYVIALIHEHGHLRAKDRAHAHLWYSLAAAAGDADAAKERDRLAREMTREEIAAAQRLAKAWQPGQCEAAIEQSRSGR